jgi:hypothetical protein
MARELDLFERFPDGSVLWRGTAIDEENAQLKLQEFARMTSNECFAMDTITNEIVARVNSAPLGLDARRRVVVQIAYDEVLLLKRAELLRNRGYDVISAFGNESAKAILESGRQFDIFIVGHSAADRIRAEIVSWIKMRFPGVKILALNSAQHKDLEGADYNVVLNGPEKWLALVDSAAN